MKDPWVAKHSMVDPTKLHAIGVVAISWNAVETIWELLLWELTDVPPETGQRLTRGMGIMTLIQNAVEITERKGFGTHQSLKDAAQYTTICNTNRNGLVHAQVFSAGLTTGRSKKATLLRQPIDDDIKTIRKVAEDVIRLRNHLLKVLWYLVDTRSSNPKNLSLPGKLPPPIDLASESQKMRNKHPARPRSSRS